MSEVATTPMRDALAWATNDTSKAKEPSTNPFVWLWEAIEGDFNDERSTAQILFDAAVSMIPLVDQLCDMRDLVANVRKLSRDARDMWNWVALVLTLIGLFPTLGSLVKGVLKIFFAFIRHHGGTAAAKAVDAGMTWVITFLRRRDVQRYISLSKIDEIFKWLATEIRAVRAKVNVGELMRAFDRGIDVIQEVVAKVRMRIYRVRWRASSRKNWITRTSGSTHHSQQVNHMDSDRLNNKLALNPWQQKQAAMLTYYSSLEYLISLHTLVTRLIDGNIDPVLDQAKSQGRDAVLVDERWGTRDTSQNWSNNGWPYLKGLQDLLAKQIAERPLGKYAMAPVNESFRGMDQFSLGWMTPDEKDAFDEERQKISDWASPINHTMADRMSKAWNDFYFACHYPEFACRFDRIPKFRIRTDTAYPTGVIPKQTGIYIAKDDPHAALQFVWSGKHGRELRQATTFNELGLAAFAAVGRQDLWFSDEKMFKFTTSPPYAKLFHDDVIWRDGPHPNLAPSAVARRAFTKHDSEWYLVELIEGEFDSLADLETSETVKAGPRITGGEKCVEPGFYFSPSRPGSRRYLAKDELAPTFDTQYGQTFWQWDAIQT